MTAYESMYMKMLPLKSYNLEEGSNVYNEISAYGEALDKFRELLDEFLRECFISTAETYGLERRELLVGEVKVDLPVERRRNMLITRNILGDNDFTKEGISKFMDSFGVTSYDITEMPQQLEISVQVSGDYTKIEKIWIKNQIVMMLPAHLNSTITFQNTNWKNLDNNNLTFSDMDSKNYSWKKINNIT